MVSANNVGTNEGVTNRFKPPRFCGPMNDPTNGSSLLEPTAKPFDKPAPDQNRILVPSALPVFKAAPELKPASELKAPSIQPAIKDDDNKFKIVSSTTSKTNNSTNLFSSTVTTSASSIPSLTKPESQEPNNVINSVFKAPSPFKITEVTTPEDKKIDVTPVTKFTIAEASHRQTSITTKSTVSITTSTAATETQTTKVTESALTTAASDVVQSGDIEMDFEMESSPIVNTTTTAAPAPTPAPIPTPTPVLPPVTLTLPSAATNSISIPLPTLSNLNTVSTPSNPLSIPLATTPSTTASLFGASPMTPFMPNFSVPPNIMTPPTVIPNPLMTNSSPSVNPFQPTPSSSVRGRKILRPSRRLHR